ncbi:MAG: YeeE/YedE family protein [Candidatus Puniceispirillaceae bacterium]
MTINWMEFTPLMSFVGGLLIGAAALILMVTKGRVMGISGILAGMIPATSSFEFLWRLAFVAGVIAGPLLLVHFDLYAINVVSVADGVMLYLAALLVGVGTAIGSGCTSGHGICGLARLSPRSFAAVMVFVLAGVVTVTVLRHLL